MLMGVPRGKIKNDPGLCPPHENHGMNRDASPLHSTAILLDQVRNGDEAAINRLYDRYRDALLRWASGRLPYHARDLVDTEDLVQDALIQSLRQVESFDPQFKGAFHGYLRRAILNRIRDQVRRAQVRDKGQDRVGNMLKPGPSPVEEVIGLDALERYEKALETLSESDREVIIARVEMGASYEDLAELLGKPSTDAVRMALKRALTRLAKEMQDGSSKQ